MRKDLLFSILEHGYPCRYITETVGLGRKNSTESKKGKDKFVYIETKQEIAACFIASRNETKR